MQRPTLNRRTQGQHLVSKAVDYDNDPDPIVYSPEAGTIDSYQQRGVPGTKDDAGNALRMRGGTGLHQFAHLSASLVRPGEVVKRGQPLAVMGYTGYTQPDNVPAGAHLHYWVQTPKGYVYPENLYNETFIKLGGNVSKDALTRTEVIRQHQQILGTDPGPDFIKAFEGHPLEAIQNYLENPAKVNLIRTMKKLSEGTLIFEANLPQTQVWKLETTPNYKSAFTYKKGDRFEVDSFIDTNGTRYYISAPDALNARPWGVNTKDIKLIGKKPTTPSAPSPVNRDSVVDYISKNLK